MSPYSRRRTQCPPGGGDLGGAGLVSRPAGVAPDPQECLRHGSQQVQADAEQGAVSVQ